MLQQKRKKPRPYYGLNASGWSNAGISGLMEKDANVPKEAVRDIRDSMAYGAYSNWGWE